MRLLLLHATALPVLVYASTKHYKIFQTIKKLWSAQEFGLEIHSGEITTKRIEQELFFLHAALLLDLIYVHTIFYQIISNNMGVRPAQDFCSRTDTCIKKNVTLLHMNCLLVFLFISFKYYQIISNSMGVMACTRF